MTTIRLHDSLARQKRDLAPLDPKNVRMYVCGPTVYDRAHIGNARPAVVFDVLFRLLRHVHGADHVTYVRNITDVDDKIMARAAERGAPIETVTAETERWFNEDMAALGCLPPTHQPRATEFVSAPGQRQDMVRLIAALIDRGHAYAAEGHVLFDVPSFPAYGRLSGRSTEDMIAGARVEVAPYKRDPMDFVLWKPSAPDQPGWDSPWGRGRPGWHIECSAMAEALLGRDFDIHGGGADLMFPHHENEIAQSVCACEGAGFARFWLHNGMVTVDGRKMSKSLGNFFTVRDKLAEGAPGEAIRLALLMTHYRDALDWTAQRVHEARATISRWRKALDVANANDLQHEADGGLQSEAVLPALADDLNTSVAIRGIDIAARHLLEAGNVARFRDSGIKFLNGLELLGFGGMPTTDTLAAIDRLAFTPRIDALLAARAAARGARDFAAADAIRKGLDAAGVVVMDRPGGPTEWELGPSFDAEKLDGIEP